MSGTSEDPTDRYLNGVTSNTNANPSVLTRRKRNINGNKFHSFQGITSRESRAVRAKHVIHRAHTDLYYTVDFDDFNCFPKTNQSRTKLLCSRLFKRELQCRHLIKSPKSVYQAETFGFGIGSTTVIAFSVTSVRVAAAIAETFNDTSSSTNTKTRAHGTSATASSSCRTGAIVLFPVTVTPSAIANSYVAATAIWNPTAGPSPATSIAPASRSKTIVCHASANDS
ncbi:hypothetical protein NECAME_01497 [Necator americanus]|uniref:Uncharacterized protein n=1 Tax=Necator americanus TaxID=51031 RepID=W2TV67_NECAM|nr:hypothetical protein NECAME_01497 [Necator americanus]ETN84937.1 hypothetical protein NECAME_01497 [Necator americanus]